MLAQSIGGGGGFSADSTQGLTSQLGPSTKNGGSGKGYCGNVYVTVGTGTSITTHGSNAHGIFAQSVSGGGGIWDDGAGMVAGTSRSSPLGAKGTGHIGVNVEGSVSVSGSGAWGVYAQNVGPNSTGNPVKVYVSGAITASGAAAGAVRMLTYQGQSYLKTSGTGSITGNLYSNTAVAGSAAAAAAGAIVVPQWNPRPVTARFVNEGTFVSEAFVTGLNVTNNGSLSIAGAGNFGQTTFSHDIDGTGRIIDIDADFEHGKADRLIVAGEVGGRQTLVMRRSRWCRAARCGSCRRAGSTTARWCSSRTRSSATSWSTRTAGRRSGSPVPISSARPRASTRTPRPRPRRCRVPGGRLGPSLSLTTPPPTAAPRLPWATSLPSLKALTPPGWRASCRPCSLSPPRWGAPPLRARASTPPTAS